MQDEVSCPKNPTKMNIQNPMKYIQSTQAKIYKELIVGRRVISINICIIYGEKKLNKEIRIFSVNFGHNTFSFEDQMLLDSTVPPLDP